jgi:uncharacterized repeat protein (TIGR01451 family)
MNYYLLILSFLFLPIWGIWQHLNHHQNSRSTISHWGIIAASTAFLTIALNHLTSPLVSFILASIASCSIGILNLWSSKLHLARTRKQQQIWSIVSLISLLAAIGLWLVSGPPELIKLGLTAILLSIAVLGLMTGWIKLQARVITGIITASLIASFQIQGTFTPAALAANQTFAAGAYIIDMGQATQTVANGLKPYGLIYDLVINQGIPVKWAINPTKAKDGVDFTANAKDYKGSAFIIPAEYATSAASTITTWKAKGVVVDGGTAAFPSFTAPIFDTITSFPKAVLDTTNGPIAVTYFTNAEIPATSANTGVFGTFNTYRTALPSNLNSCDDLFVLPHGDPTWANHKQLLPFNQSKGYIWSACHAVSVLENIDGTTDSALPFTNTNGTAPDLNFLSGTNGLVLYGAHSKVVSPPYTYTPLGSSSPYQWLTADTTDPIMQFMGTLDGATTNGSEEFYLPKSTGWRPTTKISVHDPTQASVPSLSPGPAAVVAYGRGFGNASNGMVMYEGGHNHNDSAATVAERVAAQRAFFNFVLLAGLERRPAMTTNIPSPITSGSAVTVSATGGNTYQWASDCGGTFASSTAASTTFTAPSVSVNTICNIRVAISDGCSRHNFDSKSSIIEPVPLDYSDAPSSYGSASHTIVSGTYLGTTITADSAAYNSAQADGDTGDDGITLNGAASGTYILNASTESTTNNTISINPKTNGFASLWIDYNQDGDFADAGEQVLNDQAVSSGIQNRSFNVPTSAIPGYTFARVRYSTTIGTANTPTGTASNGEVEDYVFKVQKTTAPLACSAGSSTIYTSLDFRHLERLSNAIHWARRAGTLPNGKLVDVRFTRSGTSLGTSDTWDTISGTPQTAPADAITQAANTGSVTRNFQIDVFEAGTSIPVVGNYIFNFADIDGHNQTGARTSSMPTTTYTNNFENQHFYGIAGYTLSSDTRLYLDPTSNFPVDLFIQSAASNNSGFDTTLAARQLAIRVAWENKNTMNFTYYTGQFGGIDIDGQGYNNSGITPNCSLNLSINGTVFNDTDSSKIQNGTEAGTNSGGLNAVLLNSSNAVVNTVAVAANGTYSFSNVAPDTYTVLITTGNTATITLPTNWVSTGENFIGIADLTVDSKLTVVVGVSSITGANFGIKQNPADVLLLKRITAINGLTTNPNDHTLLTGELVDPNWKAGYVVGATDGGRVKPGDTIEYTIYYLNNGGRNAKSVRICDRLSANQSFYPNTYPDSTFIQNNTTNLNPVGSGMQITVGTNTPLTLTNISDGDGGEFIAATSPVSPLPTNCNFIPGAPNNDNGALILDLVTSPGSPNLTALLGKTDPGSPNDSFGFWRFITKVSP